MEYNYTEIAVSKRAITLPSTPPHVRRGTIRFVGPVPTIPFPGVSKGAEEDDDDDDEYEEYEEEEYEEEDDDDEEE